MASVPAEIKNRWLIFISKPPAPRSTQNSEAQVRYVALCLVAVDKKCRGTELNRRRRPFQGRALPTELPRLDELITLTEAGSFRKERNSGTDTSVWISRSLSR